MIQRQTDLVLLYGGGSSSSERGVAYPVVLRNTGVGTFWDVELRSLHEREETDRNVVRQLGPQSETGQIFLLIPAKYCDEGTPGIGLRPLGHAAAEVLLDGEVVATVDLPGGAHAVRVERVPRTDHEEATLLQGRQDGWEYLLFAAVLLRQMNKLEPMYRDHEIGFATPQAGLVFDGQYAMEAMGAAMNEASVLVENVNRLLDAPAQERAFGAPGAPGDPDRIDHLASRIVAVYEGLLDWADRMRGIAVAEAFKPIAKLVARFVDLPVQQFREFIHRVVAEVDRLPTLLAAEGDETVVIHLTLTVAMEDGLLDQFHAEIRRLEVLYSLD